MNALLHRINNSLCALFEKDCIRFGATYEQIALMYDHLITITARDNALETKNLFDRSFYGNKSVLICYNLTGNQCSLFALNCSVYELFTYTSPIQEIIHFISLCRDIGSVTKVQKTTVIKNINVSATDSKDGVQICYVGSCSLSFRKPTTISLNIALDPTPPHSTTTSTSTTTTSTKP